MKNLYLSQHICVENDIKNAVFYVENIQRR